MIIEDIEIKKAFSRLRNQEKGRDINFCPKCLNAIENRLLRELVGINITK